MLGGLVATLLCGCPPERNEAEEPTETRPTIAEPSSVYDGGLWIGSHDGMVDFCAEYDGVGDGLEVVELTVEDLGPLDCLVSVGGFLILNYNPGLVAAGLPDLSTVGGRFEIWQNSSLTTVDLPRLVQVGELFVSANGELKALELPWLLTVESRLAISQHAALPSISLPWLEVVGGDLVIENNLALLSISADRLESVEGDVIIRGNPLLGDAEEFVAGISEIGGQVIIEDDR